MRASTHYKKSMPHRVTLLSVLSKQKENIEVLSDFKDKGSGNIILGITRAVTETRNFVGKIKQDNPCLKQLLHME